MTCCDILDTTISKSAKKRRNDRKRKFNTHSFPSNFDWRDEMYEAKE